MSPGASGGFSLIELVVVIVLAGFLAWIAYPTMTGHQEVKLDAAARRLASDLRYAQSQALSRRVIHGILFEPASRRYTVFAPDPSAPLTDPVDRSKPLRVDYASSHEYSGVTIASATFGATPGIKFDYFGVPRDTAGIDLATPGLVILAIGALRDTVEVTPETGVVTVR